MQTQLQLVRKRLLQCSKFHFVPWKFTAIPEFAPPGLDGVIEYYKLIIDYIANMPEAERQLFETMPDGSGCTGRMFLDSVEPRIKRILAKRQEENKG